MGKKYLLYIHDERFNEETEKSKLVNTLLDRHYEGYSANTKSVMDLPAEQHMPKISQEAFERTIYKATKDYSFCKHDAVKGMCKKGCK